jgi:hypothetical protein
MIKRELWTHNEGWTRDGQTRTNGNVVSGNIKARKFTYVQTLHGLHAQSVLLGAQFELASS